VKERLTQRGKKFISYRSLPLLIFIVFMFLRLPFYNVYGDLDEALQIPEANWLNEGQPLFGVYGPGHPPLWFWTIVVLWRMVGVQDPWTRYYIAKTLSIVSVAITSALIYIIAEKLYHSRISGILSCFLLASSWNFAYYGITASVNCYAIMLMMISFYLLFIENKIATLLSPLFIGLTAVTRYSVVPVIPLLLVFVGAEAIHKRRMLLIPASIILAMLPFLSFLVFYGEPLLRLATTSYVGHTAGELTLREIWPAFARTAWIRAPTLFMAVVGSIPFLLTVRDDKKYLILLSCIVLTTSFFLEHSSIEPHRLLESESVAAVIGGAIINPILNMRYSLDRRAERKMATAVRLAAAAITAILIVSFVGQCYVEVNGKASDLRSSDRNTYLPAVVEFVETHTSKDDYVISSISLIPFLANRRTFIIGSTTDLVEVCETYQVKLVVVGPLAYERFSDRFMAYLAEKYHVAFETPYWGKVMMR